MKLRYSAYQWGSRAATVAAYQPADYDRIFQHNYSHVPTDHPVVLLVYLARIQELGIIKLQDSSGGNVVNFIHQNCSVRIPFRTILAINIYKL